MIVLQFVILSRKELQ